MRPRHAATLRLLSATVLGLVSSVTIALIGGIVGMTDISSSPSGGVAVVEPKDGSAIIYREWKTSWLMRQIIMDKSTSPHIGSDGVSLGPDRGIFPPQAPTPRAAAAPWDCHPPNGEANTRIEYQFGWPWPCMWGAEDASSYADMGNMLGTTHIRRVWPRSDSEIAQRSDAYFYFGPFRRTSCHFVPTGFRGGGLLADTLAQAPLWWLLVFGPGRFRRALRLRRGLCLACGYDLSGLPPGAACPECGRGAPI